MKKILFIAINARYVHSNPAILYLKKTVSDLHYYTVAAEFSINENPERIIGYIREEKPHVVALSVYIWNAAIVKSIIPFIKKNLPGIRIVCGGPEVSYNASEWLGSTPEIDYIVTGSGEAGFRKLALSDFEHDGPLISIPNFPFSDIAFPYDDAEMKRLSGKFIYYESSRGCPFRCSYCLSSRGDQRLDFRGLDLVRDELDFFKYHKPGLVKFVDRTFNSRKDHYRGIWEYLVKNFTGVDTRFHFEIYPDLLDSDDLDFLAAVPRGLFQFEIGIQSIKSETLAAINRGERGNGWLESVKTIAEQGNIHLHVDLIAGLPYESYSAFSKSFNTVHGIGAAHFQCGFLKVLPGTEMRERACEFGLEFSPLPPYQVKKSLWINSGEMERLHDMEELLEVYYNSGKFRETEKFLTGKAGSPFEFYEKLSLFYKEERNFNCREWAGAAALIMKFSDTAGLAERILLRDYLRWDWCSSMKMHHYPDLLKSGFTLETKRRAFNHVVSYSGKSVITFHGYQFSHEDLRRSIFFRAESDEFRNEKMSSSYAMFLPDKRVISFDID